MLFNAVNIFGTEGFSNGKLVPITVGLVQFVGTGLICLIMDKAGLRILLLTTALRMCASLLALGVYFEIYIPSASPANGSLANGTVSLLGSASHFVPAKTISWLFILSIVLFFLALISP